jgi:hypothetical protein
VGKAFPCGRALRLGRPLLRGHPATPRKWRAAGGRARSRRFAAPTGPPLPGAFKRRRPLDGASRLAWARLLAAFTFDGASVWPFQDLQICQSFRPVP